MKRIFCLLMSVIMMCSSSIGVSASESEEYIKVSVEYSDNVGSPEKLYLMVKDSNVFVNAEMLAYRLGYRFKSDDGGVTIYNKDNNNLPVGITQFFFDSTKVNHMLFSKMVEKYEAPFSSVKNDKGFWIPLEYSLLILNSSCILLDKSILIDIPKKNIIDYYYDIMKNVNLYNFDWNKDFGYTESDRNWIGGSSHFVNLLNGILDFDGDSWAEMFQSFILNSSSYDEKYGKDLSLLLCGESEEELKASIEKIELYQDIFSTKGQLGKILSTYSENLDSKVDVLYDKCEQILKDVQAGNSPVITYNSAYQALVDAFDKKIWFSNTGGNIIEVQRKLSDATSILDIGLNVAKVVGYSNEFANQDEFSHLALINYLKTSASGTSLPEAMKQSMQDYSDILSSNIVKYSATRFLEENIDEWIVDGISLRKALGTQANIALFAWNIASNIFPYISNGLDAADKFELSLYSQVFQSDTFINYQSLRNRIFGDVDNLNPEDLYNLTQYCYVYVKSCYITRNVALGSLIGKSDSIKEQIQPLIDYQNSINTDLAKIMVALKEANNTNANGVYGFLLSDNEKYLDEFNNNALKKWVENHKSIGTDIFKQLPQSFSFSSGVGNWETYLDLNPDGTFTGQFHDLNMGETGDGYSNGTVYICNFDGKFSAPTQVDEYRYSMNLEYLNTEGTPGNEYYENNTRYIYDEPYGLDNADEFLIYLPGIRIVDLPEGFAPWLYALFDVQSTEDFPYYGIYNVGGKEGFIAESKSTHDESLTISSKTDLSQYLNSDLISFVEMIGDMYDVGATGDETEYSNGKIIASAYSSNNIVFVSICGECGYSIKGIEYGISFKEATQIAEQSCSNTLKDLPNYKCFVMNDGTTLSFHAEDENMVDQISLFAKQ